MTGNTHETPHIESHSIIWILDLHTWSISHPLERLVNSRVTARIDFVNDTSDGSGRHIHVIWQLANIDVMLRETCARHLC